MICVFLEALITLSAQWYRTCHPWGTTLPMPDHTSSHLCQRRQARLWSRLMSVSDYNSLIIQLMTGKTQVKIWASMNSRTCPRINTQVWECWIHVCCSQFCMCLCCRHEEDREQSRGGDSLPKTAGISHSFGRGPCQDEVWYTVLHGIVDVLSGWLGFQVLWR